MHGTINVLNYRIWANENPHAFTAEPLYSPHVTVLPRGFTSEIIFSPFFFEEPCARLGWKAF